MKNYFLIMIIISGCLMEDPMPDSQITQAIPANSNLIIKFYDINKIRQKLESFKWWEEMKETKIIHENFSQTDDIKACEWCDYKLICRR